MSINSNKFFFAIYFWCKSQIEEVMEHFYSKFEETIENRWFWVIIAIIAIVGIIGYAFFCTSRGYNFNGNVKLHWPRIWQAGIGCSR